MPTGFHTGGAFDQLGTIAAPLRAGVVANQPATVTLTADQTGAIVLFDRAAGLTYTLPPPTPGLQFIFAVTVSITSGTAKVITDAPTTLLLGSLANAIAAGTSTQFIANGTTHRSILQNGSLTGGLQGSLVYVYCVSGTQWLVDGTVLGSGASTTPFGVS